MASAKKLMGGASLGIAIVLASVFFLFYSGYLPLPSMSSSDMNEDFQNDPDGKTGLTIVVAVVVGMLSLIIFFAVYVLRYVR